MDSAVAEQLRRGSRATSVKDNPDAARLVARASSLLAQGSIGAARIVVEGHQAFHLGQGSEGERLVERAVAPTAVAGIFGRAVLAVVDQEVRA